MAIRNPSKEAPKPKTGSTALQEQCSIIAMYYCIAKGASMNVKGKSKKSVATQDELVLKLKKVYPAMSVAWENTFMNQAKAISNYIGHSIGSTSGKWDYGWFDGTPAVIPAGSTTDIFTKIWDLFPPEATKLFGNKKDSWNTADVYLLKKGQRNIILKWVTELKEEFIGELCCDPGVFIGTLNTYLTKLVHKKILLPISLKAQTKDVDMTIKETNMHEWNQTGEIDIVSGDFKTGKHPWAFFNVKDDSGLLNFGEENGAGGNSLQYFAEFRVGDYETKYLIEQRLAGKKTKAEVKDIKLTNKGKEKRAAAQTGQVPQPEFEELVKDYTGESYEDDINMSGPLTSGQIQTWNGYLKKIASDNTIKKDLGDFKVLGISYPLTGGSDQTTWIEKVAQIDADVLKDPVAAVKKYNVNSVDKFSSKFRLKLKQLRFISAMIKAKSKGELAKLLTHIYYLAAKQNLSEGDIRGPFLKIS